MVVATEAAGTAAQLAYSRPEQGSPAAIFGKVLKWAIIIIIALVVIAVLYIGYSLYAGYGLNPLDPSTYDDAIIAYVEAKWGVTDTGQSGGGSLWTVVWRVSIFGWAGAGLGLGTSATGRAGLAENAGRIKNALYTLLKRGSGN